MLAARLSMAGSCWGEPQGEEGLGCGSVSSSALGPPGCCRNCLHLLRCALPKKNRGKKKIKKRDFYRVLKGYFGVSAALQWVSASSADSGGICVQLWVSWVGGKQLPVRLSPLWLSHLPGMAQGAQRGQLGSLLLPC